MLPAGNTLTTIDPYEPIAYSHAVETNMMGNRHGFDLKCLCTGLGGLPVVSRYTRRLGNRCRRSTHWCVAG
jgi:hypothetical protein